MSDPWWPPGTDDPAFQVKRETYGALVGGDYVRGSTVQTLQQTALRYPTTTPGFDAVENQAFLYARPMPHQHQMVQHPDGSMHQYEIGVAEVSWGWPLDVTEKWLEVALVRSGFGHPITVNDGQTVMRASRPDFTTPATPATLIPAASPAQANNNDYHIINNYRITSYVSLATAGFTQYLASLWSPTAGGRSWAVVLDTLGNLRLAWSLDGTVEVLSNPIVTAAQLATLSRGPGGLTYLGIDFLKDNTPTKIVALRSEDGVTWTELGSITLPGTVADTFDVPNTLKLSIGSRSDGATSTRWAGQISWIQGRDLVTATTPWRFDVAEYPEDGSLTWADPRGVSWTISTTDAVTRIIPETISVPPPIVYDKPLQRGQMYYYTLFFKTTQLDWIVGMTTSVLIPRDYRHAEHLWNTLPPYYQYLDSNLKEGNGPLRTFFSIFGYELDLTREFVEQWQQTYHVDKSPMHLLRRVGENLGVPYEDAPGDIRYRGLMAAMPDLLLMRGTPTALKQVVEAGSKCLVEITTGENMMILPDDSAFVGGRGGIYDGVGNWGTMHPGAGVGWDIMLPENVSMANNGNAPPATYGAHSLRIRTKEAQQTANLAVSCGCNLGTMERMIDIWPITAGIPVEPGSQYGFVFQLFAQANLSVTIALLWFNKKGRPVDYLAKSQKATEAITAGAWSTRSHQGIAPPGSTYVIPALYFTNRVAGGDATWSGYIDIAGVQVYLVDQVSEPKEFISPDKYLTLGDDEEKLGELIPGQDDTTGFLLGSPRQL